MQDFVHPCQSQLYLVLFWFSELTRLTGSSHQVVTYNTALSARSKGRVFASK